MELDIQLSRKYRSQTVDDIIGNHSIVESLRKLCERKSKNMRLPQTYLIHGVFGCGKTSIARILAKIYNCSEPTILGPCGKCPSCQSIDSFIETGEPVYEVKEVDATKDDSKNDMDNILEDCMYPTAFSQYIILIIDEAHMAKEGAQQRLLKVLEEPPSHLVIILCTTEKEKIKDTIQSRCTPQYHVTQPKSGEIVERLAYICEQEGVDYSKKALRLIVRASDNIVRTSLNKLEQIISEEGVVDLSAVEKVLNLESQDKIFNVFKMLDRKRLGDYLEWVYSLSDHDKYFRYLSTMFKSAIYAVNNALPDISPVELKLYKDLFGSIPIEEFIRIFYMISEIEGLRLSGEVKLLLFGLKYMGYSDVERIIPSTKIEKSEETTESLKAYKEKHKPKQTTDVDLSKPITEDDLDALFGKIEALTDN